MPDPRLTAAEFRSLYDRLRHSSQHGSADRRGGLNYITGAEVAAAAAQVRTGQTVSLGARIETGQAADNPDPCRHQMTGPPDGAADSPGLAFAMDRVALNVHGNADSHIDALCHVIYDGSLYNGVSADTLTAEGATELSIDIAHDGIVGRGVLLDIPRLRGVPWLEPGDHVTAGELAAAEQAQRLKVSQGDILLVRVGHRRRRHELGPWDAATTRAGLHPGAVQFAADRRVAVLGSDGNNDTAPSVADGVDFPVHVLAIQALGLQLLDYLQFDELRQACTTADRWSFLCVIAPLRLPTGTGSPVNPIAIF